MLLGERYQCNMTSARSSCGPVGAASSVGRGTTPVIPGGTGRRKTGREMELSELNSAPWLNSNTSLR